MKSRLKNLSKKIEKEVSKGADKLATAVESGKIQHEAKRIGKQIGATAEKFGQQVAGVAEKAYDQSKELIIREQTADAHKAANERVARCKDKHDAAINKIPANFLQDDIDLIAVKKSFDIIKELAEKIRSRDQAEHADYAFKGQISDNAKNDCEAWLETQRLEEEVLDNSIAALEAKLATVQTENLPPLMLSTQAKNLFAQDSTQATGNELKLDPGVAKAFSDLFKKPSAQATEEDYEIVTEDEVASVSSVSSVKSKPPM